MVARNLEERDFGQFIDFNILKFPKLSKSLFLTTKLSPAWISATHPTKKLRPTIFRDMTNSKDYLEGSTIWTGPRNNWGCLVSCYDKSTSIDRFVSSHRVITILKMWQWLFKNVKKFKTHPTSTTKECFLACRGFPRHDVSSLVLFDHCAIFSSGLPVIVIRLGEWADLHWFRSPFSQFHRMVPFWFPCFVDLLSPGFHQSSNCSSTFPVQSTMLVDRGHKFLIVDTGVFWITSVCLSVCLSSLLPSFVLFIPPLSS